jgi:hypothetical protein
MFLVTNFHIPQGFMRTSIKKWMVAIAGWVCMGAIAFPQAKVQASGSQPERQYAQYEDFELSWI